MRVEVARLDFPIPRMRQDFEHGRVPDRLIEARDAILAADHLVMIFPLWHGTMPALLKAFIERVMRPGVALEYRKHGFPWGAAISVSSSGIPSKIPRCQTRTGRDHPLPAWPTFLPGHLFAGFPAARSNGCWRSTGFT
jgi:NAD(P)H-dependent FMN reductase